jgi:hypothetical protein
MLTTATRLKDSFLFAIITKAKLRSIDSPNYTMGSFLSRHEFPVEGRVCRSIPSVKLAPPANISQDSPNYRRFQRSRPSSSAPTLLQRGKCRYSRP